jgi:hypothetical protein
VPRCDPDRHRKRSADSLQLDLHSVQTPERAARDDLCSALVSAREHDRELSFGRSPNSIELTQLLFERLTEVGERALRQLGPVLSDQLLDFVHSDQQAAELGAVTLGARYLLLEALEELCSLQALAWRAGSAIPWGAVVVVGGSHAFGIGIRGITIDVALARRQLELWTDTVATQIRLRALVDLCPCCASCASRTCC